MTFEDSIKHILDKIENDEELRKLAMLIDQHPEKKDEILQAWANDIMEDAKLKYQSPPQEPSWQRSTPVKDRQPG